VEYIMDDDDDNEADARKLLRLKAGKPQELF
jgi:hypothetical protein